MAIAGKPPDVARPARRASNSLASVLGGTTPGERLVLGLGALTALAMVATIYSIFALAPLDNVVYQGGPDVPFRIFYFHVPIAWVAYLAFFIVFVSSVLYLWRKDERWDWLARAAAEVGTVFTTLVLITGSIWGRTIWGLWWDWSEPRLTTTLILWFIYVGYLLLRSYTGRTTSGARSAAVLGIVGFASVPIDYISANWWNQYQGHPPTSYIPSGSLAPAGVSTLMLSLATFTLLFGLLLTLVYHLQSVQTGAERSRGLVESELE